MVFLFVCFLISVFVPSLTYIRAGGKSSQGTLVGSHIWFNSFTVVAKWVCKRSGGHGSVLKLFIISFWRQYLCVISVKVTKQDSIGLGIQKSGIDLVLAFRDRRGLCGPETGGSFQ